MTTHCVYIIGPKNEEAYAAAAAAIGAAGHVPVNPLFILNGNGIHRDYRQHEALVILIRQGTAAALLPGWTEDREATLEHAVAMGLGYPVADLDAWTGQAAPAATLAAPVESDLALAGLVTAFPSEAPPFDGTHRPVGTDRCSCGKPYEDPDILAMHIQTANMT